jgi:DNA-binding transcriptional regulator YiaG
LDEFLKLRVIGRIYVLTKPNTVRYNIDMRKWTSRELKTLRKKYKFSQRALGDLLGVSEQHIYYLERGARIPSKTLKLLLDCVEAKLEKGE